MLTSRITKEVPIPHEPGEWLRIRRLPGKKLEEAREEKTRQALVRCRAMGGEAIKQLQETSREEATQTLAADPFAQHDTDTLLRAGIIAWSYEEKPTPQNIEDLDEQTRQWAAREIFALSFVTEDDSKNV